MVNTRKFMVELIVMGLLVVVVAFLAYPIVVHINQLICEHNERLSRWRKDLDDRKKRLGLDKDNP